MRWGKLLLLKKNLKTIVLDLLFQNSKHICFLTIYIYHRI